MNQPLTIPQALQLAIQCFQAGQLSQAESLCQQILAVEPHHSEAWHGLGIIAVQRQDYDAAVRWITQAIAINPTAAIFYNSLGNVYWYQGRHTEAIMAYQQALRLQPDYAEAYNGLGNVLSDQGSLEEAKQCYQQAIVYHPHYPQAYNGLGNICKAQGEVEAAISHYQQAIALLPNYVEAYNNLGGLYSELERLGEALEYCRQAVTLNPRYAKAYNNLGNVLRKQFQFHDAIVNYQQALALDPNFAEAYSNLGNVWRDMGMVAEAIDCHRKALSIKPMASIYSSLLFALNYVIEEPAESYVEYQRFGKSLTDAIPSRDGIGGKLTDTIPGRDSIGGKSLTRLKIGYLSADFRRHSVVYFMAPILAHHDHDQFEIIGFHDHWESDEVTRNLQNYTDQWVNCKAMTHQVLAETIRQAKIDILVDLMGHTGYNRMPVLAQRPAPIQVSYLGYPNTTGLTTINYRLTDNYVEPMGVAESFSMETLIRLSPSYFCYQPYESSPPVQPPPNLRNGYITFGSFNYYPKLSTTILSLWAKLLQVVPNSRLIIKSNTRQLFQDPTIRQSILARLAQRGLDLARVELIDFALDTETHLSLYQHIDIALDSYPYNGATTTCEALWMGVPVITLVGQTHAARMGLSILTTVGLTELIANSGAEYLHIGEILAGQPEYLQQLRETMRERMQSSPLMDGARFTRQLEEVYQRIAGE